VVHEVVTGGAAYISMHLNRGDVIMKVDDIPVSESTVLKQLVEDNLPRSTVIVTVASGGMEVCMFQQVFLERLLS
jgi:S1-C subfamily serine protease